MTNWNRYWERKNLKKRVIEFLRKKYFARVFANIVKKHITTGPVLEAGCGSGEILKTLAKKYKVIGVDNSEAVIRDFNRGNNYEVRLADIRNLPFKDKSFEVIYNQGVMEHFSDKQIEEILREFKRVADKVVILVPSNLSVFRIYNPFDVDDARFLSPEKYKGIAKKVFPKVSGGYIIRTFFITMVIYAES